MKIKMLPVKASAYVSVCGEMNCNRLVPAEVSICPRCRAKYVTPSVGGERRQHAAQ